MSKKEFRNPSLLQCVVEHFDIKDIDSNFPRDKFDPFKYPPEVFFDKLQWASEEMVQTAVAPAITSGESSKRSIETAPQGQTTQTKRKRKTKMNY